MCLWSFTSAYLQIFTFLSLAYYYCSFSTTDTSTTTIFFVIFNKMNTYISSLHIRFMSSYMCNLFVALKSSQSDLNKVGLPENTTAVVSLAGQNILDPLRRWTEGFKQNVWASRVNTTRWDFIIIILCLFFLFPNLDM